jgi:hypothetical protein
VLLASGSALGGQARPAPPAPPVPPAPVAQPAPPGAPARPAAPAWPARPDLSPLRLLVEPPLRPDLPGLPPLPQLPDLPEWPALWHLAGALPTSEMMRAADQAARASAEIDRAADARQRADDARQRADDARQREADQKQRAFDARRRAEDQYQRAQDSLERGDWARAVERFTAIIDGGLARMDASLYWKAYALDKLNQQAEALAAVAELVKTYPNSRWLSDAKALEIQVRQRAGQPIRPEAQADEDLKLLAIQALQHSDPEQAVPMLEQILKSTQPPRVKQRALFVLAQSNSARAREVMSSVARGGSNPDLQSRAIQYLGVHGNAENRRILADIYASSSDVDIKRQILRAFMVSGDRERVLAAATTEEAPELRQEAVRQLGTMGARTELWQLYRKETVVDVKRQILQSLFVAGDSARLIEIANGEPETELRRTAVRQLGTMSRDRTGEALVALYAKEKDSDVKNQVINGLFVQDNAEALVAIARKETDPAMKRAIVSKLSVMKSKVALDYLMELLKQ